MATFFLALARIRDIPSECHFRIATLLTTIVVNCSLIRPDPPVGDLEDRPMQDRMNKVALGFKLLLVGSIIIFSALCLQVAATLLLDQETSKWPRILIMLIQLAGCLTNILGFGFCMFTPREASSAKSLVGLSGACYLLAFLIPMGVVLLVSIQGKPLHALPVMFAAAAAMLLPMVGTVLFLMYSQSLAQFLRRKDLAKRAGLLIWMYGSTVVLLAFAFGIPVIGVAVVDNTHIGTDKTKAGVAGLGLLSGACVSFVLMLLALVTGLTSAVMQVMLLANMSAACARGAGHLGRGHDIEGPKRDTNPWSDDNPFADFPS